MYNNIGKKIKVLVELITLLLCLAWLVISIGMIYTGKVNKTNYLMDAALILGPILFIWISGFFFYGFGELVDSSMETKKKMERIEEVFYQNDKNKKEY